MNEAENKNYLRHITELGKKQTIVTHEDIRSNEGIKLVTSGTRVNASFYEKLLKHKLLKPIDQSLKIEECLSAEILKEKAAQQIKQSTLLEAMQKNSANAELLFSIFSSLKIPEILLFKLTVAEKQLPVVFNHCLNVAIASVYIAIELKQNEKNLEIIAIAGLFHDIGLLHLDVNLFNSNKKFSENDRKQIYSHPIVANLMLKTFPGYQLISHAIIEHHERMDGSGYPQGLEGKQIDLPGQILIVAELAISLTEQKNHFGYLNRLQAILKFNTNQYPHTVVDILLSLLKKIKENIPDTELSMGKDEFLETLSSIWSAINSWDFEHDEGLEVPYEISTYISNRLNELTHALNMSGLNLDELALLETELDEILADSEEMMALLDEAMYQVKNIVNEITRRWPNRTVDEDTETAITKWLKKVKLLFTEAEEIETESEALPTSEGS